MRTLVNVGPTRPPSAAGRGVAVGGGGSVAPPPPDPAVATDHAAWWAANSIPVPVGDRVVRVWLDATVDRPSNTTTARWPVGSVVAGGASGGRVGAGATGLVPA